DLKFLVSRVETWFQTHGERLALPKKRSVLAGKIKDFGFLADGKYKPSVEQIEAVRTVIEKPFSYIWGAPGTGKTRFVLAYAVLQYLREGKKVAIFAPTNNAVEQVLRGVLPLLEEEGFDIEKVIRLGTPSQEFAERYPEVCETTGLYWRKREADQEISELKGVLPLMEKVEEVAAAEGALNRMEHAEELPLETLQDNLKARFTVGSDGFAIVNKFIGDNLPTVRAELENWVAVAKDSLKKGDSRLRKFANMNLEFLRMRLEQLQKHRQDLEKLSTERRIQEAGIVACTLDAYISRFMDQDLRAHHYFLDEAGYANVAKALTLFRFRGPITFLGDHQQLPPVSEMNDQELQDNPDYHPVYIWSQSAIYVEDLFLLESSAAIDRYFSPNTAPLYQVMQLATLNATYRFGNNLAAVLNAHVYRSNFHSSAAEGATKLYYLPASYSGSARKTRQNEAEAALIQALVRSGAQGEDFVILSPYSNQVSLLQKYLPKAREDQRILTVHRSQGQEWDTVILSVVDPCDKRPWFTDSRNGRSRGLNLLNTAVSRARRRLIIVCDLAHWQAADGQLLQGLISVAQEFQFGLTGKLFQTPDKK
ncbi:MAG TPA: hypothetical protein ENJ82_04420, partial [Bacteroidetes bacterium]|nr:hypothetical protein [Bacteroidota bacterium]